VKKKSRIAVLAGGWSGEREVSLNSGRAVYNALDKDKYVVTMIDPRDEIETLFEKRDEIDLIFNILHGKLGEDGNMQGFLNILGIPFVGSGVLSSSLCMNKKIAKERYRSAGLQVASHLILNRGKDFSLEEIAKRIGMPLVIKPVSEGSSIGISICRNEVEVREGIENAFSWDREIMLEEYIKGREITCCVLGSSELQALPIIEIVPDSSYTFFDYEAKYKPGASKEICPADIPENLAGEATRIAKTAHKVLHCAVWSRSDMIIRDDKLYLLETNTIPGMTETSLFPLAAKAAGLTMGELLDKFVSFSMENSDF
jgi:D-alanine-D-alanine ligase